MKRFRIRFNSKRTFLWPGVAMLLLVGILAEARMRVTSTDAEPHLQRCKTAIEEFPVAIPIEPNGIWIGSDIKPPEPATQALNPTVILARKYIQPNSPFAADESAVDLYIINAHDATDLLGYYAPVCYRAQSMQLIQQQPRSWKLDGIT